MISTGPYRGYPDNFSLDGKDPKSALPATDRRLQPTMRRLPVPLTVLEIRNQRAAADAMVSCDRPQNFDKRPPIFDAAFVLAQGAAAIAKLLNDCYYDLVASERGDAGVDRFGVKVRT